MSLSNLNGVLISDLTAFNGISSISAINGMAVTIGSDVTAPTLTSATVAANGTTLTLVFSEAVTRGAGYADTDLNVDASVTGENLGLTYVSGDGTSTFVYTVGSTIQSGETVDLDFNGDVDSLEDSSGNDLAAIVSGVVTNNSTQGAPAAQDDFSWATGTPVSISSDANWTVLHGGISVVNTYGSGAFYANDAGYSAAYFDTVAASQDQEVEVTVVSLSAGEYVGPAVRIQSGATSYYGVIADTNAVGVFKMIAGTPTNFGSGWTTSLSPPVTIKIRATGSGAATRLKVYIAGVDRTNDIAGVSEIDPGDYLNTGYGGVTSYAQSADAAADDFKWYNL